MIVLECDTTYLSVEIEKILGRSDRAAEAAIKIMLSSDETNNAFLYCDEAEKLCKEALKKTGADLAALKRCYKLLRLQLRFLKFCKDRGFAWSRLSVFGTASGSESIVTFLFMNLQCDLGVKVMKACGVSLIMVARRLTDMLANEDDRKVFGFLTEFERVANERIFRGVVHEMVARWMDAGFGEEKLLRAIRNGIGNGEFKCLVLLELGCLEEAMGIAKRERNGELLGVVGNLAFRCGCFELAGEAQKEVSRFG
jgi:hypothetical protein